MNPQNIAISTLALQMAVAKWNARIPACAVEVRQGGNHIVYRHPTKGYRRVSLERLRVLQ